MIDYYVMDPTGNVTILVVSEVPVSRQPETALALMAAEPQAEQVGFVRFLKMDGSGEVSRQTSPADVELRMAGGEFCGNASMSCAALYLQAFRNRMPGPGQSTEVSVKVSGAEAPVNVIISADDSGQICGTVDMPLIEHVEPYQGTFSGQIVSMQGITHLITEEILEDAQAEEIVRRYAYEHEIDAVGLMQINLAECTLKPLVFVDPADTLYWEHSCASGTSAAGAALAYVSGKTVRRTFTEPGGTLSVEARPDGRVKLTGRVCMAKHALFEGNEDGSI